MRDNMYQTEKTIHDNYSNTKRSLDINATENKHLAFDSADLDKVQIRFDTNPKYYQKEDYMALLDVIHAINESDKQKVNESDFNTLATQWFGKDAFDEHTFELFDILSNYSSEELELLLEIGRQGGIASINGENLIGVKNITIKPDWAETNPNSNNFINNKPTELSPDDIRNIFDGETVDGKIIVSGYAENDSLILQNNNIQFI